MDDPMNILNLFRVLFLSLFLIFTVVSCGGADDNNTESTSEEKKSSPSNLQYIKSASIIVNEVWIRDTEDNETELLQGISKSVQLVPTENNFADMYLKLTDLPAGDYEQVRLVLDSGKVLLTDNVYIEEKINPNNPLNKFKVKFGASRDRLDNLFGNKKTASTNPQLFTTQQGNLKFPSGFQSGIKANIEPPIKIITNLATELLVLSFDLNKSFIFNGSATKKPGVKRVLFKPVIKVNNDSTTAMLKIESLKGTTSGVKCTTKEILSNATVTAINVTEETIPTTTDENGNAQLILLAGHYYNIEISKTGYETKLFENVFVDLTPFTLLTEIVNGLDENITLKKDRSVANRVFDKDTAILMAMMSNVAYEKVELKKLQDSLNTDPSIEPNLPTASEFNRRYPGSDSNDYQGTCWKLKSYIVKHNYIKLVSTQLFVAINKNTGDIVVSFEGTSGSNKRDLASDYNTDLNIRKVRWDFRNGDEENWNEPKGKTVINAVHNGAKIAYKTIDEDLKIALDNIITDENIDTSTSKVYFTGHSLGAALANLAALDFTKYLQTKYQYDENNIMMYGFGSPRVITQRIEEDYQTLLPNSYAVAAKDDIFTYMPGLYDGFGLSDYTHLKQHVVISTNIRYRDINFEKENYTEIGKSRLEYSYLDSDMIHLSKSKHYGGCLIGPLHKRNVGFLSMTPPSNTYHRRGHDRANYIQRLLTTHPDGQGKPTVDITNHLYNPNKEWWEISDWKLRVSWKQGVQGPCDRMRIYSTDIGSSVNNKQYICTAYPKIWAAKGGAFGYDVAGIESSRKTCKDPRGALDKNKNFWVEYLDGFDNVLAKKLWARP